MADVGNYTGPLIVPTLDGSWIYYDRCTPDTCSLIDYAEINYLPSLPANLVYLAVFFVLLLAQMGLGWVYRTWIFLAGMFGGLVFEVVGYGGRIGLHYNPFSFSIFLVYLICLTIGPALLSASIYYCLSRLIILHGAQHARFRPRTYIIIFISCDLLSLTLQAVGGALAATAETLEDQTIGVNIMIAGLSYQAFSLALFMVLCLDYVRRYRIARCGVGCVREKSEGYKGYAAALFPCVLATSTILIFIRSIYRVVELDGGFKGELANDQTLFLVFEGPMIILAVLGLTVCHPGFSLPGSDAGCGWKDDGGSFVEQTSLDVSICGLGDRNIHGGGGGVVGEEKYC